MFTDTGLNPPSELNLRPVFARVPPPLYSCDDEVNIVFCGYINFMCKDGLTLNICVTPENPFCFIKFSYFLLNPLILLYFLAKLFDLVKPGKSASWLAVPANWSIISSFISTNVQCTCSWVKFHILRN